MHVNGDARTPCPPAKCCNIRTDGSKLSKRKSVQHRKQNRRTATISVLLVFSDLLDASEASPYATILLDLFIVVFNIQYNLCLCKTIISLPTFITQHIIQCKSSSTSCAAKASGVVVHIIPFIRICGTTHLQKSIAVAIAAVLASYQPFFCESQDTAGSPPLFKLGIRTSAPAGSGTANLAMNGE